MNKFLKILAVINGILLPLFLGFLLYKATQENKYEDHYYKPEDIIVGVELEQAKKDSLAIQGISYEEPRKIYNSTNYYIPISALTYKEAKDVRNTASSAGNLDMSFYNYFNVLFLDKNYKVIGKLLDTKASISDITISESYRYETADGIDTTAKNIAYMIAFHDTNNDGKLNFLDESDLYISDLNGKNLVQVTSKKDVDLYKFIRSNSEIFIQYTDRNGRSKEHNRVKFAVYNIKSKMFVELKDIEENLNKIEAELIK
jgi:hypothetical protein